jgi:hypothetical protein
MKSGDSSCPRSMRDVAAPSEHFLGLLDAALHEIDDQVLVTQSRCVDHLLDLLNATDNSVLRRLTVGALDSVRRVGVVRGDELHVALSVLSAAANVELAAAGARAAAPCDCC